MCVLEPKNMVLKQFVLQKNEEKRSIINIINRMANEDDA
jgi:hypothetical protein